MTTRSTWTHMQLADGRTHAIQCPAANHPGDRSSLSCKVRKVSDDRWMLKCWSGGCAYTEIAAGLGIELRSADTRANSKVRHLVAVYEHPDGKPREVYRKDWPRDFPNFPSCPYSKCSTPTKNPHKHVWGKGSPTGTLLLLWGTDDSKNALVLVEGEKAAASLASADVNEKGFTPVSWRGGTGSVRKVDFGRVIGRRVIVWADNNEVGRKAMDEAAGRCVALGISALHMVDVDKLELPDGGDAADLDAAARLSALEEARAYVVPLAMLPAQPAAQATAPVPKWLKPDYAKLLDDEYDVQNPDSDAARYLRQHGPNTLIVRDIGGQRGGPASVMGLDTETGLWTGTQYVDSAIMRQAQDAHSAVKDGIQPGGVFPRKALTYLGRVVRSSSHRSEAMRSMPTVVYAAMEPFDVVEIPEADMDKVGRYLGAANGVVDLSTARLLPPSEGKLCGVSRSTTVAYRPRARHPYVDSLFKYLDSESADFLKMVLGQGLYGRPDDVTLVLTGPTRGGKTTLMEAIKAAVGPSYYGTAAVDVAGRGGRYSGGSHTEDKRALYTMRYCGIVESESARVDSGKFKSMTGGDTAPFRGIGQAQVSLRPTALIIWSANSMPALGMDDPVVQERVRIVDYPQIPTGDRNPAIKKAFVEGDQAPSEAMLALLVEHAVRCPPGTELQQPEKMLGSWEREIRLAQNKLAVWTNTVMDPTSQPDDKVAVNELWELWAAQFGEEVTGSLEQAVGDVTRRKFPSEVRRWYRKVGLPPQRKLRIDGQVRSGWARMRLSETPYTQEMDLDAQP